TLKLTISFAIDFDRQTTKTYGSFELLAPHVMHHIVRPQNDFGPWCGVANMSYVSRHRYVIYNNECRLPFLEGTSYTGDGDLGVQALRRRWDGANQSAQ